jgi:hypothetical protein
MQSRCAVGGGAIDVDAFFEQRLQFFNRTALCGVNQTLARIGALKADGEDQHNHQYAAQPPLLVTAHQ